MHFFGKNKEGIKNVNKIKLGYDIPPLRLLETNIILTVNIVIISENI